MAVAREGRFGEIPDSQFPVWVHPARAHDEGLRRIVRLMAEDTGAEAFVRQQTALLSRPDSRPGLAAIRCPTLVLVGDGGSGHATRPGRGDRRGDRGRAARDRAGVRPPVHSRAAGGRDAGAPRVAGGLSASGAASGVATALPYTPRRSAPNSHWLSAIATNEKVARIAARLNATFVLPPKYVNQMSIAAVMVLDV